MDASLRGARVVVTGGCGFIGSHLVRRLDRAGVEVRVLDDLSTGRAAVLADCSPRVRLEEVDVLRGGGQLPALLEGATHLFHLAAIKHHQARVTAADSLDANIIGTHRLLEAAVRAGVRKVVFTSSLYAYGRRHEPPMGEDEIPCPTTVYGVSKLAGEHLLATVLGDVSWVALRLFFVYGPAQYSGSGYKSVIVKTFERLLAGEPPVMYGDGLQALDYSYVDDVTEAIVRAMVKDVDREVINVGSGSATRVIDLIGRMIEISGRAVQAAPADADETAGTWRVAKTAKLRRLLDFTPRVSLDDGLMRTWDWMKERS